MVHIGWTLNKPFIHPVNHMDVCLNIQQVGKMGKQLRGTVAESNQLRAS
jgi:hypothetical protein